MLSNAKHTNVSPIQRYYYINSRQLEDEAYWKTCSLETDSVLTWASVLNLVNRMMMLPMI